MTKDELAEMMNGRDYGDEITESEALQTKAAGLLVVFGYSDDNAEFVGAFDDEVSCFNGGTMYLNRSGVLPVHDHCKCQFCGYKALAAKCVKIEALWCREDPYSWTFKTSVPHAPFDILEDGEKFCRGLVIDVRDLPDINA